MAWFELADISEGVTRIVEPHVHIFFQANLYRIAGRDFDIQLDFGVGVASMSAAVPDKGRPVLAVASHAHVDHVGSFHEFGRRAGHPLEAEIFAAMNDDGTLASWFAKRPDAVSALPAPGWSIGDYALQPAPLTETLCEGDVIDLGNRAFTVLHLPGHSPGSIGLLDEKNGEFFSADAIYDGGLVDDIPGADIAVYLETMRRLADLDVSIVHPGHGDSFDRATMRRIALGYIAAKSEGAAAR